MKKSSFIKSLLAAMTVEEKTGQINERIYGWHCYRCDGSEIILTDLFKEHVAKWGGMGHLYGLMRADPWTGKGYGGGLTAETRARVANLIQKYVKENTRLGVPVILSEEAPHGHQALDATNFPVNIAMGCAFNTALYEKVCACIAREIKYCGGHNALVSALDICRDPRWGRAEECFTEDPYLASAYTAAAVRGVRGEGIEITLKHLCAQGAGEGGFNTGAAPIGEREMREIHLPAARAGAESGARFFMASYNEVDGILSHCNPHLLNGILRREFGFKGVVMADGYAVERLNELTRDTAKTAALALKSGVGIGLWDSATLFIPEAVEKGCLDIAEVDKAVERILNIKYDLGLFKNPYAEEGALKRYLSGGVSARAAYDMAAESIVLLENRNGVLPLNKEKIKKIAVIGPNADSFYNILGDYTASRKPGSVKSIFAALKEESGISAGYALGCGFRKGGEKFEEAVSLAENSDAVILVLGGSSTRDFNTVFDPNGAARAINGDTSFMDCGEGLDVASLVLPGSQNELFRLVKGTGKPVVTVLVQGRPYAAAEIAEKTDALLTVWYCGEKGAEALRDIIFGRVNPSGRLSVSIPRSDGQLPVYYNKKYIGRENPSYCNLTGGPLYPFGYGLSYSNFVYENLTVKARTAQDIAKGQKITVTVNVINVSDVPGKETVQLYIRARGGTVTRRVAELKGFRKLGFAPREKKTAVFTLGFDELSAWSANKKYETESGEVTITVHGGSQNGLSETIRI